MASFKQKLSYLMRNNGLSQSKTAVLVGVSQRTVSDWLSESSYPRPDKIKKISEVFGINPEVLTDDSQELPSLTFKDDVIFADFENDAIDGLFYGKIAVSPRHVNYPLLCRYEAKIAGLLGNAGFATKEVFWDIKCDAVHIGFMASALEIK